jgi:ankyrin repeat protein
MKIGFRALAVLALSVCVFAQGNSRLAEVVHSGDAAAAMELLKQGSPGQSAEADGTTALHWAVQMDDARLVSVIIGPEPQIAPKKHVGGYVVAKWNAALRKTDEAMVHIARG